MTDSPITPAFPIRRQLTPITQEELLANWEASIDLVIAGETLMIITDGKPVVYLMPIEEYEYYKALQAKNADEDRK